MRPERQFRGVVLVLDDDPVISDLLSAMLARAGFEPARVGSLAAAAAAVAERAGALVAVVCDLELPGESGLVALRAVRATTPAIVAIVVSGHPEERLRSQLGPDEADVVFFQKPFRAADLIDAIEERL